MTQSPAFDLSRQRQFGRYEILERLGGGGMGDVYRARDLTLGRLVAIKVLREPATTDPNTLARFEQEARSASALNHPNIVTIHEIGSVDGVRYIAMELVDGRTLRALLREAPLLTRRSLQLAAQAADGLARAHEAGIVHRDLKPENIMVTRDGRVKILDFGLAKLVGPVDGDTPTEPVARKDTAPGTILGTVGYMSPEQAMGQSLDFRSDQFSCGSILYEMATGRAAFRRSSPVQTMAAIIDDDPEPIASLNPAVPPPLRWIITRCLCKDPAERYVSTTDLARDLANMLDHLDEVSSGPRSPVAPPGPSARRLARMRAALAAAVVVCIGLAATLWLVSRERPATVSAPAAGALNVPTRRSVAVLGFKNLSGQPDAAWLSTAIAEMLTTELAAGGRLRTIPGENVARMKIELSLSEAESLAPDTLDRVGRNIGTDLVVLGSYLRLGSDQIRLDLRLQDVRGGETLAALAETGTETGLVDLVTRTGARLRHSIGVEEPSAGEGGGLAARIPSNVVAQRHYAEGLSRLRVLDALAARDLLERAAAADPRSPLVHLALADAWTMLGYDGKAKEEMQQAFALSGDLPREDRLSVEGRYREAAAEWAKAVEIYAALLAFFPDNVEYGLRLATALSKGSRSAEALATLENLRKLPAPSGRDPRIDLAEAAVAQSVGDFKRQAAAANRAAVGGMAQGARLLVARARLHEASALDRLGEVATATAAAEESRRIYAEADDRSGLARALNALGSLAWVRGDLERARQTWEESLGIRRQIGYREGMAVSLYNIGLVLWEQGQLAAARRKLQEAEAIDKELADRSAVAAGLSSMAGLLYEMGHLRDAKDTAERARLICAESGDKTEAALVLVRLATLRQADGDLVGAERGYREALTALQERGTRDAVADAHSLLGDVLQAKGDLVSARKSHQEALTIRTALGAAFAVARSQVSLARLSVEEGHADGAEPLVREASSVFVAQKAADREAEARAVQARALLALRRPHEALAAVEAAAALSARSQSPHVRLAIAPVVARVRVANGRPDGGLETALALAGKLGLVGPQLELRLARCEVQTVVGACAGGDTVSALASDARARGYGLVARRAEALLRGATSRTSGPS